MSYKSLFAPGEFDSIYGEHESGIPVNADVPLLTEMATGAKRGLFTAVPEMVGGAMKAFTPVDSSTYKSGQELQDAAKSIAHLPELQKSDTKRGITGDILVAGAEGVGQMVPVLAASVINPIAGAAAAATMYGGSTYQDTKERMLKQDGLDDAFASANPTDERVIKAKSTALATGAVQGAGEAGMTYLGGRFLKGAFPKLGAQTAENVVEEIARPGIATLKNFGKAWGTQMAGEGVTEALQDEGQAAVERFAGLKDAPAFMDQAADSAKGGIGTALLLGPLAGPGHYKAFKDARQVQQVLADPAADPALRVMAAQVMGSQIATVDEAAAKNFQEHAYYAIGDVAETGSAPYALDLDNPDLLSPYSAKVPQKPEATTKTAPASSGITVLNDSEQAVGQTAQPIDNIPDFAARQTADRQELRAEAKAAGRVLTAAVLSLPVSETRITGDMYSSFAAQPFAAAPLAQPAAEELPSPESELEKAINHNAQLWQTPGQQGLMQNTGTSDAQFQYSLIQQYRRAQGTATGGSQEKANGITDILPNLQNQGPSQVDGQRVAMPIMQKEVAGVGSDNIQPGGIANVVSSVRKETGKAEEVSPVRGEAVTGRITALQQEKEKLLAESSRGITGGLVYSPEVTKRLKEINAEIQAAGSDLDTQAHAAAASPHNNTPEPTQAQIEAGNYKKGHVSLHGLNISIENPAGSTRKGVDESGKAWETKIAHHYGYFKGTVGKDKDHIDTFIGPDPESQKVFVVDQIKPGSGVLDEHKVMMGFKSLASARAGYLANYDKTGAQRIGAITESSVDDFKQWLKAGNTKKAFASAKAAQPAKPLNTRRQLDTSKDSLIVAIAKLGGISRAEIDKQTGTGKDLAHTLNSLATKEAKAGILHVISSKGISLDKMREALVEQDYLKPSDDINTLLNKLDSASRGQVHRSTHSADAGADAYSDAENRYSEMINAMSEAEYEEFSRNQWLDNQVVELADASDLIDEYLEEVIESPMSAADWQAIENDFKEALNATEFNTDANGKTEGTEQAHAAETAASVSEVMPGDAESEVAATGRKDGVSGFATARQKQSHDKFKAKQSEATLGQKYAKRFNFVLALAKAKHEAYKTKVAAHQTRKRVAEANVFTALTSHAEVGKLAAALNAGGFNEQAEKYVTAHIQKMIDAAETPQEMLAYSELLVDGKPVFPASFFASLKKDAAKAFAQSEKDKNRDPEVYRAALENSQIAAGILPDISLEDARQFKEGFDHALKGKTKSTLPGEGQYAPGYKAAQSWMLTDTGMAWFEGKRLTKEKSTGDSLRRAWDKQKRDLDSIDSSDMKKAWQRILKVTARAERFPILLAEDATPGAQAWMEMFRATLNTFSDFFTWEVVDSAQSTRRRSGMNAESAFNGSWTHRDKGKYSEAIAAKREKATPAHYYIKKYNGYPATALGTFPTKAEAEAAMADSEWKQNGTVTPVYSAEDNALTNEERLTIAKQIAEDYQRRLQDLAVKFAGIKDLAGIEKAVTALFGETPGSRYDRESAIRDSDTYKQNRSVFAGSTYDIAAILPTPDPYTKWSNLKQNEEIERNSNNRRDSLVRPRLDKIVRKGVKDVRAGKDMSADQLKKTFGFADITIGQYVTAQQAQDHINYTYDALMTLTDLLKCQPKDLSFGGQLHYAIGALGHGKYAAHFSPNQPHPKGGTVPVINVTNTKGDGAFLHEFFHAIDFLTTDTRLKEVIKSVKSLLVDVPYTAEQVLKDVEGFLQGHRNFTRMPRGSSPKDHALYLLQHYYDRSGKSGRQTDFYREAVKLDAGRGNDPYWSNNFEPFARMAEAWGYDALKDQESRDDYLVSDWCADGKTVPPQYKGTPYPRTEERGRLTKIFGELVNAIKWTAAGPVLNEDHKWQEILPYEDASAPFQQARKDAIAKIDEIAKNLKERKAEEAAEKQRLKDEAVWGKAPVEEPAPVVAPPSEVIASEDPQVGTSFDELEAIFDQVADSMAAEAQEPATNPPGAALFEHQAEAEAVVPPAKAKRKEFLPDGKYGPEGNKAHNKMYATFELHDVDKPAASDVRDFNKFFKAHYQAGWAEWTQPAVEYGHLRELADDIYKAGLADGAAPLDKAAAKAEAERKQRANNLLSGRSGKLETDAEKKQRELQEKTAAELAKEFAEYGVKGIDEALKGLTAIFGGGQGKLMSFPAGLDKESYDKAKPHFEAAAKAFNTAGFTFKEFVATFFRTVIKAFGLGVKPYAVQFAKEYEETFNQLQADQVAPAATTKEVEVSDNAPGMLLSLWVKDQLAGSANITWQELFKKADEYYGGTQAAGVYSVKDAYDAVELGINQYLAYGGILQDGALMGNIIKARHSMGTLAALLERIPTQTKRTAEMDEFQQFSTPPHFAYLANWVANLKHDDTYLEPSAGIGGMAVFAKIAGVKEIIVNELSARRLALLRMLPFDRFFSENAEQLDNILPDDVKPTVIVMNPPFSSTAGRVQGQRDSMNGGKHVEQALARLAPGGRLVAIVGEGMASTKPALRDWWKKIEASYSVRANIGIDATSWAKYGTTFDNQILVIDKVAPTGVEIVTGKVSHPNEAFALLEGIRNERPIAETAGTRSSVADQPGSRAAVQNSQGQQNGVDAASGSGSTGMGGGRSGAQVQPESGQGTESVRGAAVHDGSQSGSGTGNAVSTGSGPGGRVTGDPAQLATDQAGNSNVNDSVRKSGGSELPDRLNSPLGSEVELKADDNSELGEINNSQFEQYTPKKVRIEGSVSHNTPLVESAALAAVSSPDPTYTPNLPKDVITKGLLSDAQLESVVYAGQAHQQWLVNGQRRGFFLGDGTGVGKGRQISGIIMDNMRQGQKKAVWISKKSPLIEDAKRDFSDIGGDAKLIFQQDKTKSGEAIPVKEGILFAGYKLLQSGSKAAKQAVKVAGNRTKDANGISYERTQQIANWLGKDFDGVIVFDESHEMGNAVATRGARGGKKPSNQALAALELQRALPKAKIVYVSATGATEVSNLAYAERLGLWGEGTPFGDVSVFIDNMSKSVSAMELVAQNLKQMGLYLARSLSFDGIVYNKIEHELTDYQRETYDLLAGGWQKVLKGINDALEKIGVTDPDGKGTGKNSKDIKSAIMSQFWGSHQRFFNQIITAGAMPTVLDQIEQDLAAGKSVVLQLVNTNEAGQERALTKAAGKKRDEDDDSEVEELDLTPREQLIEFIKKYFPTVQQEEYTDGFTEAGKPIIKLRPVVDSQGNLVENKEAVAMREALIANINGIRIPDSAMQMLFNHFGPERVAEITGRTQRVIYDEKGKMQIQKRGPTAVASDSANFKDGKKRILIFSQAGGTGFSFHADRRYKNQEQRVHYILQPGWSADKAIQGLGRSHRTNQSSTPIYRLVTTDIPAQKRFISSIARRLEQLGALTSGQRDTAGGALFSATDNLESVYSTRAVKQFFDNAFGVSRRTGYDALPDDLLEQMGLLGIIDKDTNQIAENKIPPVTQFLNRLLSLRFDTQGKVFELFLAELEQQIEAAKQMGSFDDGMQTVRHVGAEVNQEEEVYRDPLTNAPTRYLAIEYKTPNPIYDFEETNQFIQSRKKASQKAGWFRNVRSHRIAGIYATTGTRTDKNGRIQSVFGVWRTSGNSFETEGALGEIGSSWSRLSDEEARELWEKENSDRPRATSHKLNMVAGGILPIWNRFNNETVRVVRIGTDDGRRFLGRQIDQKDLAETMKKLNVASPAAKMSGAELAKQILAGNQVEMSNGWKFKRVKVSNDTRIEVLPKGYAGRGTEDTMRRSGIVFETIQYAQRYFVPTGEKAGSVIDSLMKSLGMNAIEVGNNGSAANFALAPDVNSATMKERIEKIKGGYYVPERIPQDFNGAKAGSALETITGIARRAHQAVQRPEISGANAWEKSERYRELSQSELRPSEEKALREWATENNLILSREEFDGQWVKQGRMGRGEHDVFITSDRKRFMKRNRLTFHENLLDYFNRLAIHAAILPDTAYTFEGFHDYDGHLYPITSQKTVIGRVSTYPESHKEMVEVLKLTPIVIGNEKPTRYRIKDTGLILRDPHGDNTRVDDKGNVWVVDPVFDFDLDEKAGRLMEEAGLDSLPEPAIVEKAEFGDEVDEALDAWDKEPGFKLSGTTSTGMQATEAQAWVKTLPIAKRVNVVQSVNDLPENARNEITKARVNPSHVQAMELHGTIHVIADNVPDLQRVKALVIGHELAHAGQTSKIVDLAVDWFKRTVDGKTEAAKEAHLMLEQIAERYGYDLTDEKQYRRAVQEATAAIAEQAVNADWKPSGLMQRLFMYVKHWLRQRGLISHVSDSELSLAVAEMLRIGEKRLSVGGGGGKSEVDTPNGQNDDSKFALADQAISQHTAKINAPAKVTDMVKSLAELAGQSIPERLKANIGKVLSNPWFGSEGKPIRRHVVSLNLERSQNRNGIISDLFQASEGYTGVEGLDNILKKASKEEIKLFNDLIKHGDENGVAKYFTRDELYRGKTKFGKVGKTVVEAYRAFHEVMNAANRVRFQQLDELSLLPYKDQEWFDDLVELLNKNMERAAGLDEKEAGEVHRLIRSLKRGLTDEQLASGENPAKIQASPAVIAAYRAFWAQVDQTDKKHQGNMLSAFRDILGYRGELDKLKNQWGSLRGYAPRNRKDGDWHVSVYTTNDEGERVKVFMKPTLTETGAKGLVRDVQADLEKYLKGNFDAAVEYEVEYERNTATPSELLAWKGSEVAVEALLNQAFDRAGVTGKMSVEQWQSLKHEVFQEIAKEIMAQGFGRHGISREETLIEGYEDTDYQTVLKEYISGMSGWLSKMRFAIETTSAAKDISKADPSDKVWVNDYVQDAMKNSTYMDELAATARSVGAVYYLGFKVSSALLNAFQNYTVGQAELSLIMKKAGHKGSAVIALAKAQKDVMTDWADRKRGGKGVLSEEEHDVLFRAVRNGTAQAQAIRMISGSQEMGFGTSWKKFTEISMTPFAFVEQHLNREPAILAAYRIFKKSTAGEFDAAAFKQAEEFVNNTHYVMGKENLPEMVRKLGPLGKTAYLFQGYVHNYMHWMYNRAKDGEFATVARSFGAIAALGGVFALPGADDLDKWIMKWFGVSYKMKFKKFVRDNAGNSTMGQMVQDFVNHGVTSVAGVDMSRALAVNIPFIGDPDKTVGERMGGAWGGLLKKPGMALNAANKGDYLRAVENLLPEFAANPLRAARQYNNGATTMSGKPVFDETGRQMKYSVADVARKALGFNPLKVSELNELKGDERELNSFWKAERDDALAGIRRAKTPEEMKSAVLGVIKYNTSLRKSQAFGLVPIISADSVRKSRIVKPQKKTLAWEQNQSKSY